MVEVKTFLDEFDDLERLYTLWKELAHAKHEINRNILSTGFGSLDNKTIFTEAEKERFMKLRNALDAAGSLVYDKISDQKRKCVKANIIGLTEDDEVKEDETEFF